MQGISCNCQAAYLRNAGENPAILLYIHRKGCDTHAQFNFLMTLQEQIIKFRFYKANKFKYRIINVMKPTLGGITFFLYKNMLLISANYQTK